MTRLLPALLFAFALTLTAQRGVAAAEATPTDRASSGDFSVFALITDDADWLEKWQTSEQTAPEYHPVGVLHVGEKGQVLTLFTGATGKNGSAELSCQVRLTEGNGKVTEFPAQTC